MNKKLVLHDYNNCIANLPNSILKKFGLQTVGKTLPVADEYLKGNYKNVVVLVLDGLGTSILEGNLDENGFLRKHFVRTYNTVFPPTTVAATTSVISGMQPIEHSWLGWNCYYPQIDKNVTVFLNTEQGTDKAADSESVAWKYCGYESVVDKINNAGKKAYNVYPFAPPNPRDFNEICAQIKKLCKEEGNKYIYSYWTEPDSTMHEYGCYSKETKSVLANLENELEKLCEELKDTLLIVTADHGHVDGRNVAITDYPQIMECLLRLPSIEPRALNLYVKPDKREQFEIEFNKAFGDDYILLSKEEIYNEQLFGTGEPHKNADGMIGDYVAIAITELTILNTIEEAEFFKGVHAGYTKEEMRIPFIVIA